MHDANVKMIVGPNTTGGDQPKVQARVPEPSQVDPNRASMENSDFQRMPRDLDTWLYNPGIDTLMRSQRNEREVG